MQSDKLSRHGTYVVTYDAASRLRVYRPNLKVPRPNDHFFRNFHRILVEKLAQALPSVNIHAISMERVRIKIWKEVSLRIQNMHSQVVLSTCQEIADSNPKSEGLLLNINRLFNTEGKMLGYGPRPGFKPLNVQLEELTDKIAGRSVVLIEDGAFTGGTLRFVLNKLGELGITVTAVVIGFCCTRAHAAIRQAFAGELVIVDPLENLVDWIPDHDLIPFIPNCGRVLGEQVDNHLMPVRVLHGVSCAYPYILPFGKMQEWATMPEDGAKDLSRFCLDTSMEIFNAMGKQVTIRQLLEMTSRVSLPVRIGDHGQLPDLDMGVVEFLRGMHDKVR